MIFLKYPFFNIPMLAICQSYPCPNGGSKVTLFAVRPDEFVLFHSRLHAIPLQGIRNRPCLHIWFYLATARETEQYQEEQREWVFLPPSLHSNKHCKSDKVSGLPVFALEGTHRVPRAVLLRWHSVPPVCMAMLVMEERRAQVVAHHLTVCWGWPLHPPITAAGAGTDARVATRWAWTPAVHGNVYQVTVKYGSVGRGPHRLSVEFHLLFRVPELEGAGPLVRRWLLPIR